MSTASGAAPNVTQVSTDIAPSTILATTSDTVRVPADGVIAAVRYMPIAAVTGAASPASRTLTVTNHGQSGTAGAVAATLALVGGVNLVAFDEKDLTLSVTASDLVVAAGDVLEFKSAAVGGTGLVDPGGTVTIDIARA